MSGPSRRRRLLLDAQLRDAGALRQRQRNIEGETRTGLLGAGRAFVRERGDLQQRLPRQRAVGLVQKMLRRLACARLVRKARGQRGLRNGRRQPMRRRHVRALWQRQWHACRRERLSLRERRIDALLFRHPVGQRLFQIGQRGFQIDAARLRRLQRQRIAGNAGAQNRRLDVGRGDRRIGFDAQGQQLRRGRAHRLRHVRPRQRRFDIGHQRRKAVLFRRPRRAPWR